MRSASKTGAGWLLMGKAWTSAWPRALILINRKRLPAVRARLTRINSGADATDNVAVIRQRTAINDLDGRSHHRRGPGRTLFGFRTRSPRDARARRRSNAGDRRAMHRALSRQA